MNNVNAKASTAREIISIVFILILAFSSRDVALYFQKRRIVPYCKSVEVTNKMHTTIHVEIEVNDFVYGDSDVTVLNIFIKHNNMVISKVILPGIISWEIVKLICNSI